MNPIFEKVVELTYFSLILFLSFLSLSLIFSILFD